MINVSLTADHFWDLSSFLGMEKNHLLLVNSTTVLHTWIIMGLLFLSILVIKLISMHNTFVYNCIMGVVAFLCDTVEQSIGFFTPMHICFVGSLFIFILSCNIAPIIPWLEEPTQDLNTTLALGLSGFFYTQIAAIRSMGLWHYIKTEFFSPLWLFPLHLIGKFTSVLSVSLRLFGNILGGAIISKIYSSAALQYITVLDISKFFIVNSFFKIIATTCALLMSLVLTICFTILEGFLQAFVFTILSLTYLSIAIRHESES